MLKQVIHHIEQYWKKTIRDELCFFKFNIQQFATCLNDKE